jgi:tetratricopeptide (TPR) repeat protein
MLAFGALLLSWAGAASAQEVRWSPPPRLGLGQIGKIDLVFDGCSPEGDVEWPETPEIEVVGEPTESRVFSMVNFKTRTSVTLGFPVRPLQSGVAVLPSITVQTDEGPIQVPASRVRIGAATLPGEDGRALPLDDVAGARLEISDSRPFEGEVVDLTFEVTVDARRDASLAGPVRWDPEPMLVETFGQPEQARFDRRNGVRVRARGVFPEPGPAVLGSASQDLNVEVGRGGVGLFRNQRMRTISVESQPIPVDVQPLPEPAPEGFTGAVGSFRLESKLVPAQARVGEPLTWSLVLSGEGNWTDGIGLPPRSVPQDIEVIRPRSTRDFAEGALFEGSVGEDLVLIPTQPGPLALEPVRFVYFDPRLGRYETIEASPEPLVVAPALAPQRAPAAKPTPGDRPDVDTEPAPVPAPQATAAAQPDVALLPGARQEARLPRLPVPGPPASARPWSAPSSPERWALWMALGALPVLGMAFALARRRATRFDALAERRAALVQIDEALEALERSPASGAREMRTAHGLAWQRATARALGAASEAPTTAALDALGWGEGDPALVGVDAAGWRRLWNEADRAMYEAAGTWPADWVERARAARRSLRVVGVPWRATLRGGNLWPALLLLVLWAPISTSEARADIHEGNEPAAVFERVGLEAYARGDFGPAADAFAESAADDPLDWKSRSDLGLARLQQGDIEAALAATTAAWVLNPRDETLRWNLAVVARRSGWIDPSLRDLAWGSGRFMVARLASPGVWQWIALLSAWTGWGALGWAVVGRHRGRTPRLAWALVAVAALVTGLALFAASTWGAFGDEDVALVRTPTSLRSIPSELAENQIEVVLEPGRVVVVERAFLGWLQVELANGDLGWVRAEVLSPVYRNPPVPGEPWGEGAVASEDTSQPEPAKRPDASDETD